MYKLSMIFFFLSFGAFLSHRLLPEHVPQMASIAVGWPAFIVGMALQLYVIAVDFKIRKTRARTTQLMSTLHPIKSRRF